MDLSDETLQAPDLGERVASWFARENLVVSTGIALSSAGSIDYSAPDPSYNPRDDEFLRTLFPDGRYSYVLDESVNRTHAHQLAFRLLKEDRRIGATEASGFFEALGAGGLAAFLGPESLVPGTAFVKAAKTARIASGAARVGLVAGATTAATEVGLQATQKLRTLGESAANVTGATVLGGVFGAGGVSLAQRSMRLSREAMGDAERLVSKVKDEGYDVRSRVQSKIENDPELLAQQSKLEESGNGRSLASFWRNIEDDVLYEDGITKRKRRNPFRRTVEKAVLNHLPGYGLLVGSDLLSVGREAGESLFESPFFKRVSGSGAAAEVMIERARAVTAGSRERIQKIGQSFLHGDEALGRFRNEVGRVASDPDAALGIADQARKSKVEEAASILRSSLDEVTDLAIELGVFTGTPDLKGTARAWVARIINRPLVQNNAKVRAELRKVLIDYVRRKDAETLTLEPTFREAQKQQAGKAAPDPKKRRASESVSVEQRADELLDNMMREDWSNPTGKATGGSPHFHERVLDIPDKDLQRIGVLVTDADDILDHLVRNVVAPLEVGRKFMRTAPKLDAALEVFKRSIKKRTGRNLLGYDRAFARYVNALDTAQEARNHLGRFSNNSRAVRLQDAKPGETRTLSRSEATAKVDEFERVAEEIRDARNRQLSTYEKDGSFEEFEALGEEIAEAQAEFDALEKIVRDMVVDADDVLSTDAAVSRMFAPIAELRPEDAIARDIDVIPLNEATREASTRSIESMVQEARRRNFMHGAAMDDVIRAMQRERSDQIALASTESERTRINKEFHRQSRILEYGRDSLLSKVGNKNPEEFFSFAERHIRSVNYLRYMGGVAISSIPDLAMGVFVHGFSKYAKGVTKIARNINNIEGLTRDELAHFVRALEYVQSGATARARYDIPDAAYGRTPFYGDARDKVDASFETMTRAFNKLTGIEKWQATLKMTASMLAADNLITIASKRSRGVALTGTERNALKISGISDEQLKRIAAQWRKHGDKDGSMRLSRSQAWDDREIRELFDGAVIQDVNRTIITPGAGDKPRFVTVPFLRMIAQFKTFAFTATSKVLASGVQRRDLAVYQGLASLFFLGAITNELKNGLRGADPTDLESVDGVLDFTFSAADRAGLFGIFAEVFSLAGAGAQGLYGRRIDALSLDRFANRSIVDIVLGPAVSTVEDVGAAATALATRNEREDAFDERDAERVRRLLPFQNLFYLRAILDGVKWGDEGWDGLNVNERAADFVNEVL